MASTKISALDAWGGVVDETLDFPVEFGGTDNYRVTGREIRQVAYELITATGSRTANPVAYFELSSASAIALTISGAPVAGDVIEIYRVGTGGVTHTVVLSGSVTWDGTNKTANFNGDADYIRAIAISATRWRVLQNTSVTFSA